MTPIKAVLFDLDGTLLDTAPDLTRALNALRFKHHLPELPLSATRPHAGCGARGLLKVGFNVDEHHPAYSQLLDDFLMLYQMYLAHSTRLFPGMEDVLHHLENASIPWGIVTNKPSRFTFDLLKALNLEHRAACIICGDSLSKRKPHPEPILHACKKLERDPQHCLYIGDTSTDVIASKSAGTRSLVTLYGYINEGEDPFTWQADGYVSEPIEIIEWLQQCPSRE